MTYHVLPDALSIDLDGVISVYASADAQALLLNSSASEIWRVLSTPHTVAQLAEILATRYDLPSPRIQSDVASVVADLVDRGLVIAHGRLARE